MVRIMCEPNGCIHGRNIVYRGGFIGFKNDKQYKDFGVITL
jgi:hypothetical protein